MAHGLAGTALAYDSVVRGGRGTAHTGNRNRHGGRGKDIGETKSHHVSSHEERLRDGCACGASG